MLKITVETTNERSTLRVEGKLTGPWVGELERAWSNSRSESLGKSCVVDLSDVTFVGAEGQKLLAEMHRQGVKLEARGCMNRSIVERIERG